MMTSEPNIKVVGEVTDPTGNERLVLNNIEMPFPNAIPRQKAYDFHSLIWEIKDGENWKPKATITCDDFQRGSKHRRRISRIHGLHPDEGSAIIQVAEQGTPNAAGVVRIAYSWRQWDLVNNNEIRTLQMCECPFDAFDDANNDI